MPPSGYPHKAVAGSTIAIRAVYVGLHAKILRGEYKSLEEAIEAELSRIEARLRESSIDFADEVERGFMVFIKTCLEELLIEKRDGKHETDEAALEYEIRQIERGLAKLHIDLDGNFVER